MITENEADIPINSRVSKSLYAKIVGRQEKARRLTGMRPSLSAVVRSMLEEATLNDEPKRRRHRAAGGAP